MGTLNWGPIMRPPNGDHPNYMRQNLPDSSIADTGSEEVEIETGISIQDRSILRYLGLVITGSENGFAGTGFDDSADETTNLFALTIQTRTGSQFNTADPETLHRVDWFYYSAGDATNTMAVDHEVEESPPPEQGQLVASPRIVYRQDNDLSASISADTYQVRLGYEFERVTTDTFLQLAEMQADIFLV